MKNNCFVVVDNGVVVDSNHDADDRTGVSDYDDRTVFIPVDMGNTNGKYPRIVSFVVVVVFVGVHLVFLTTWCGLWNVSTRG